MLKIHNGFIYLVAFALVAFIVLSNIAAAEEYHVNAATGDDANPGSLASPFKTIQRAADVALVAGDEVIVHAGTYFEPTDVFTSDVDGIHPRADGITFRAAPGERVIIDQQNGPVIDASGEASLPGKIAGFVMFNVNNITIDGFEVVNAVAGVTAAIDGAAAVSGIVVKNNHFHDIWDIDNVGAVQFGFCSGCEASNNVIHDVGLVTTIPGGDGKVGLRCATCPTPAGFDNGFANRQNSGGFFSFAGDNLNIHHNVIWNAYNGFYHKRPPGVGLGSGDFHHNVVFNTIVGVRYSTFANGPAHNSARVFQNNFYSIAGGLEMATAIENDTREANQGSGSLMVFNNTFVGPKTAIAIDSFADTRVFNNVFSNIQNSALLRNDAGPNFGSFQFSNFNFFSNSSKFVMGPDLFLNLQDWQLSLQCGGGVCDLNSIEGDPGFEATPEGGVTSTGQYFTLGSSSPAKHANGGPALGYVADAGLPTGLPTGAPVDMGAYPNGPFDPNINPGGDIVGPTTTPLPPASINGLGG